MAKPGPAPRPIEERFWAKVDVSGGPEACWPWTAQLDVRGYGKIFPGGYRLTRPVLAHRVSWELANGRHPSELHVLHHCDNRRCVNPAHLYLGTNVENVRDRVERGREGDRSGERNGRAKLNEEQVAVIRARYAAGETQQALADEFGMNQTSISRIVLNQRWKGR